MRVNCLFLKKNLQYFMHSLLTLFESEEEDVILGVFECVCVWKGKKKLESLKTWSWVVRKSLKRPNSSITSLSISI